MGGRKQDFVAGGKHVTASRAALPSADQFGRGWLAIGRINRHGVDLIAGHSFALMLKNKLFIIQRKISFGILAAKGQLANVFQVFLFFRKQDGIERLCLNVEHQPAGKIKYGSRDRN